MSLSFEPMRWLIGGFTAAAVVLAFADRPARTEQQTTPLSRGALFNSARVWDVHMTFTPDAWRGLTPERTSARPSGGGGFLGPEGMRNGLSAVAGLEFDYVHAAIEIGPRRFADVAIRFKGNGSYSVGQRAGKVSFKIDLNKYVKGQKLDGLSTINLHSTITDGGWMNETLAYRLYRDAGVPAPRTTYARVLVTVPGRFTRQNFGLYTLVENIDTNFAAERFGVEGGAIYKPVTRTPFGVLGSTWDRYNQSYDPKTDLTASDQQRVMDFCALVTRGTDAEFTRRIGEFVDLPAFATYAAVLVWLANPDSILQQGQNYYLHVHPKTRQIAFIPWDQDHSFGQYPFGRDFQTLVVFHPWTGANRFLERVFAVEAFRAAYIRELRRLSRTMFQPSRFSDQVDALAKVLRPIVAEDPVRGRLALFDAAAAGISFGRPFYGGTVVPIKPFAAGRTASVVAQLAKVPASVAR